MSNSHFYHDSGCIAALYHLHIFLAISNGNGQGLGKWAVCDAGHMKFVELNQQHRQCVSLAHLQGNSFFFSFFNHFHNNWNKCQGQHRESCAKSFFAFSLQEGISTLHTSCLVITWVDRLCLICTCCKIRVLRYWVSATKCICMSI